MLQKKDCPDTWTQLCIVSLEMKIVYQYVSPESVHFPVTNHSVQTQTLENDWTC